MGLIKTVVDRCYKINNTLLGFHEDITKLMVILKKNLFPARLIGETNKHFTRVNEHLCRDKNCHIFKHLNASKGCRDKFDISCFKILDDASTYSQLKINESFHNEQLKPELNKQAEHVRLSLHF